MTCWIGSSDSSAWETTKPLLSSSSSFSVGSVATSFSNSASGMSGRTFLPSGPTPISAPAAAPLPTAFAVFLTGAFFAARWAGAFFAAGALSAVLAAAVLAAVVLAAGAFLVAALLLALAVREELGDTYNLSCCEQWNRGQGAAKTVPVKQPQAPFWHGHPRNQGSGRAVRESQLFVHDRGTGPRPVVDVSSLSDDRPPWHPAGAVLPLDLLVPRVLPGYARSPEESGRVGAHETTAASAF